MQNTIQNSVLQILNQKAGDKYTVLELDEIIKALPQDLPTMSRVDLSKILQQLKEEGYITIKYLDAENACLTVLQMGRDLALQLSKRQTLPAVNTVVPQEKTTITKKSKWKELSLHFVASFSGGFLAGLITLIVVLCTK